VASNRCLQCSRLKSLEKATTSHYPQNVSEKGRRCEVLEMSQSLLTSNFNADFINGYSEFSEQPLTEKQRLGLSKEKFDNLVINKVFKYGYQINSNDYSNYAKSQAKGADFYITQGKDIVFAIEDKNWCLQKSSYGIQYVVKEILPRFDGLDKSVIKILNISYKKMLPKEAQKLLAENRIYIYEAGKVVSIRKDNPRANPEFFYEQVNEFKQFIDGLDGRVGMIQQTLEESIEKQRQKTAEPPYFSYFNSQSKEEFANQHNQFNQFHMHSNSDILTNANSLNSNLISNSSTDNQVTCNQVTIINQLETIHDTVNTLQAIKEQIIDILPDESLITSLNDG
jgi:hypothetical protein